MTLLKAALGLAATAYFHDAVVRPKQMGRLARRYCDRAGKPLLLLQCQGIATKVFGHPVRAEMTTDRAYPIGAPDRTFGAVLACGVLERQRIPELALREWSRVADRVFVVVPSWYSPWTWLDPTHRWLISPDVKRAVPLWAADRHRRLLSVSDKGYGDGPWIQRSQRRTSRRTSPSPSPTTATSANPIPTSTAKNRSAAPYTQPLTPLPSSVPSASTGQRRTVSAPGRAPASPSPTSAPFVLPNSADPSMDEFTLDFDESL